MTRNSKILPVIYAAAFAAAFILVGWTQINPFGFPDLDAYRRGFESGWYYFTTLNLGPLEFMLIEGVWVRLFDTIYALLNDIDATFTTISIVAVFLMGLFVARRTDSPWYLVFFLNPAFIEIAIGQIRSGLAAGLFWSAVHVRGLPYKIGLLLFAASIHTAFFLFGALYLVFLFVLERKAVAERLLSNPVLTAALAVVLAVFVTLFRGTALAAIGDERAYIMLEYTDGILLALAWVSFFASYLLLRSETKVSFEGFLFGFGSFAALSSAVAGQYGSRFVAIVVPALAVMCSQIEPRFRPVFVLQFAVFTAAYFRYWLV